MQGIEVREAREADAAALAASGLGPADHRDFHTGLPYDTLIALDAAGAVLGRLYALYDDPRGPLAELGVPRPHTWKSFIDVLESAQGRGVGRAMMAECARRAAVLGVGGIGLLVEYAGDRAGRVRFFTRCGLHEAWPGTTRDIFVGAPEHVRASAVPAP